LQHHDHDLVSTEVCGDCGEPVRPRDLSVKVLVSGWDTGGPVNPAESAEPAKGVWTG
jgi:hypothetical protein